MTAQYNLDIFDAEEAIETVDPKSFDDVIVFFSGGKDSIACVLLLLEQGIKPELWHHDVDGKGENFFDWPCTTGYVNMFAKAFDLPVSHSWREGGLEAELTKKDARTAAVVYEKPDGTLGRSGGTRGAITTRRRWPSVGSDLRTRWCSPIAKIDVGSAAISGQERFRGRKVLVVTGERAAESAARAKYKTVEPHRTNAPGKRVNRRVTQWRPVLHWSEEQVWQIIERHKVQPHPCYRLGISRCSCMICIFSSSRQAAMVEKIDPARHDKICGYETDFNHTIRRDTNWKDHAAEFGKKGKALNLDPKLIRLAMDPNYSEPAIIDNWELPAGAFGENAGPT